MQPCVHVLKARIGAGVLSNEPEVRNSFFRGNFALIYQVAYLRAKLSQTPAFVPVPQHEVVIKVDIKPPPLIRYKNTKFSTSDKRIESQQNLKDAKDGTTSTRKRSKATTTTISTNNTSG
jgi:hypothetical protein